MVLQNSGADDYLYTTLEGLIDFVIIEEELRSLNDYAVGILEHTGGELQKHRQELEKYETEGKTLIADLSELGLGEDEDITEDQIMYHSEEVLTWENNLGFVTPAMKFHMEVLKTQDIPFMIVAMYTSTPNAVGGVNAYVIPRITTYKTIVDK